MGLNPRRRLFFVAHSFWSKRGLKLLETLSWHCWMCCNPANGRVKNGWLIRPISIVYNEMRELSADWDQSQSYNNIEIPSNSRRKSPFEGLKLWPKNSLPIAGILISKRLIRQFRRVTTICDVDGHSSMFFPKLF